MNMVAGKLRILFLNKFMPVPLKNAFLIRGLIHTPPKRLKNATIFLQLDLPSTVIRHEKELFENALQTRGIKKRQL